MERTRESGGTQRRGGGRTHPRLVAASVQPEISSVEPQLCQRQRRYSRPTYDRRVQEWTWRVLRSGTIRWENHSCSKCLVKHHSYFVPFVTSFLGRWWQDLGSQLDRHRHTVERGTGWIFRSRRCQ